MRFKRKKQSRLRGSKTHGWGSMKKHRGAGNRGGRGNAGTGKRADQKKPTIIKMYGKTENYFGSHGFKRPQQILHSIKTLNVSALDRFETQTLDLTAQGYDKLLGAGTVSKAYTLTIASCSLRAKEKIEKAGGKIIV